MWDHLMYLQDVYYQDQDDDHGPEEPPSDYWEEQPYEELTCLQQH